MSYYGQRSRAPLNTSTNRATAYLHHAKKDKRILAYGEGVVAPSSEQKKYTLHYGCSSHDPLNTSAVLTIIDTKK